MKLVRFIATHFEVDGAGNSRPKFEAGSHHPVTTETERHVALGAAELVDAPDDAEKAEAAADKAKAKASEAVAAAASADAAAVAATAAAALKTDAVKK